MADISRVSATWAWRPLQMVSNKNMSLSYRPESQLVRAGYVITIQKKLGTMTLLLQSEIQSDALNWFRIRWRPVPKVRRKEVNYLAYALRQSHLGTNAGEKNCGGGGGGGSVFVDRYLCNSVQTIQKVIWPIRRLCYGFCLVTQVSYRRRVNMSHCRQSAMSRAGYHDNYKTKDSKVVIIMTWLTNHDWRAIAD